MSRHPQHCSNPLETAFLWTPCKYIHLLSGIAALSQMKGIEMYVDSNSRKTINIVTRVSTKPSKPPYRPQNLDQLGQEHFQSKRVLHCFASSIVNGAGVCLEHFFESSLFPLCQTLSSHSCKLLPKLEGSSIP